MNKLEYLIDAILDQTTDNEIRVSINRDEGWIRIVITDNLSEIGNVREVFLEKALTEAVEQLQSFVDEQVQS